MMILYGADLSSPANKVRWAAHLMDVPYEYRMVNLRAGEHLSPEFKQRHPAGKIPVIDDNGFILFESDAILKYLAVKTGSHLYPQDLQTRALVDQWMSFCSIHLGAAMNRVVYNRLIAPMIKAAVDEESLSTGLRFLNRFFPAVENAIAKNGWVSGEAMTLADLTLLSVCDPADAARVELSPYPALSAWRRKLSAEDFYTRSHPSFVERIQARQTA